MGNAMIMFGGSRKRVRLMKIDGKILQLKPPVRVRDVVQQYPNHVVLESQAVRTLGTKARALDDDFVLKPAGLTNKKRLYFLVELPKPPAPRPAPEDSSVPRRRVRSEIRMGAKERLESLMLAKRAASDLTFVKGGGGGGDQDQEGFLRVKMRLPKSQVVKLVRDGGEGPEVAEKIIDMCLQKKEKDAGDTGVAAAKAAALLREGRMQQHNGGNSKAKVGENQEGACSNTARQKRVVRFSTMEEEVI